MAAPVTTVEVLLQQIADSLVEITGLLRQASAPAPASPGADASTPSTTARPGPKKPAGRKS